MAKAIMERAEQANITLFRSPLLARALFFEIGQEIVTSFILRGNCIGLYIKLTEVNLQVN